MNIIRRRFARTFENLIAFAIGAVIVCLANGMSPAEIAELAWDKAHMVPEVLPEFIAQTVTAAFLG